MHLLAYPRKFRQNHLGEIGKSCETFFLAGEGVFNPE